MAETIIEFLLARLDEDEAEIGTLEEPDESAGPNGIGWAEVGAISEVLMCSQHRALRECEAKRRIVDDVKSGWFDTDLDGACKHLASVYSDHPDYRQEWRP